LLHRLPTSRRLVLAKLLSVTVFHARAVSLPSWLAPLEAGAAFLVGAPAIASRTSCRDLDPAGQERGKHVMNRDGEGPRYQTWQATATGGLGCPSCFVFGEQRRSD